MSIRSTWPRCESEASRYNNLLVTPAARPHVSIIIPVFNQGQALSSCLRALATQTYPADRFEVIVVDNGSEPPIIDVTREFSFARCIREEKPGSYAARNRGVQASNGEILGFTDADCVPADTWIERGVHAVQSLPGDGMVGGKVELTFQDPGKLTAAELYDSLCAFRQETFITWGFCATANLFTTRAAVDHVGPFNERLMSLGDMEWGQRLRSRGLAQQYADDVRVSHPARRTLGQLFRQTVRIAGGGQQLAEQRGEGTSGLSSYAREQLVHFRRIRANLADPLLGSPGRKLRFAAAVWLVDVLRTLERYRVHYGGRPKNL